MKAIKYEVQLRHTHRAVIAIAAAVVLLLAIGVTSAAPALDFLSGAAVLALAGGGIYFAGARRGAIATERLALLFDAAASVAGLILVLHAQSDIAVYAYAALLSAGWLEAVTLSRASAGAWAPRNAVFLATAAVLLLAWAPFWLSYFPGIMSPDSISEWTQAMTFHLSDYSPAVYTLFIWLTGHLLRTPAGVSLVQVLLSAGLIAALFQYLHRSGAPRSILAVGIAIYLALPIYGTFTVTLWHDILYSLIALWVTHAMYQMYVTKGDWLRQGWHSWALGAALVLLPLFAHNGLSVVFGVLVGAFLVLRRQRRRVALVALGFVIGFLGVEYAAYPALGVQPYSKAFASEALLHQISAAIAEHGTSGLTAAQKAYLQRIMPMRDWASKYNPYTPQYLVSQRYNPAYNETPIDQHFGEFLTVWEEIGRKYPGSYLGERISENALVLRPTGSYKIALSSLNISSNTLGLKTRSLAQPLLATLRDIETWTTTNMIWLWRPFWVMWLLLALTVFGAIRRGRGVLFAAIPWIFQVLGLAVSIQGQSVRYYYSLFLILPYFLAIVFLPRLARRRGRADKRVQARSHDVPAASDAPG